MISAKEKDGFTLIELLVTIAIIGLLSSVVLASLNTAREKARDSRRIADLKNTSLALELYFDEHGAYPASPNDCCATVDVNSNFETVTQELVNEGYLTAIPKDPLNQQINMYAAYDYPGNAAGLLLVARLEGIESTTEGPYNSCRPFTGNMWCSDTASQDYCVCHPH